MLLCLGLGSFADLVSSNQSEFRVKNQSLSVAAIYPVDWIVSVSRYPCGMKKSADI